MSSSTPSEPTEPPRSISPSNNDSQRRPSQVSSTSPRMTRDAANRAENDSNAHARTAKSPDTQRRQPIRGSTEGVPYDSSPFPDHITGDFQHGHPQSRPHSPEGFPDPASPTPSSRWIRYAKHTWLSSKGMIMVMVAQFFGASMNTMTRILEHDGEHGEAMNPFEILFARMSGTVICSIAYMWYAKVPHPFGMPSIRALLVIRGVAGFFGVFGLYCSLLYLPLSEATVLTFLVPILSCYACSLVMPGEVFTRMQQLAGVGSLLGVILIARPMSLFSSETGASPEDVSAHKNTTSFRHVSNIISTSPTLDTNIQQSSSNDVDATHRLIGIVAALAGVLGATVAYTTIRKIGQRAHALVSVTYFSVLTTIISIVAFVAVPSVTFRLPGNWTEVLLLFGLGTCGFLLQFLLTAGLAYVPPSSASSTTERTGEEGSNSNGAEKHKPSTHGSRATSMVYTQMLFALFYDKVVWNTTPPAMSWAGSAVILCSAIYVALARDSGGKGANGHAVKVQEGEIRNQEDDAEEAHATVTTTAENGAIDEGNRVGDDVGRDVSHDGESPGWWRVWRWRLSRNSSRYDDEIANDHERRGLLDEGHEDDDDRREH